MGAASRTVAFAKVIRDAHHVADSLGSIPALGHMSLSTTVSALSPTVLFK